MAFPVVIQPSGDAFLLKYAHWRATHRSEWEADRWPNGMRARNDSLSEARDRHSLAPEDALKADVLREVHFGLGRRTPHRVIDRIGDDTAQVIAVRHTAQRDLTPDDFDL